MSADVALTYLNYNDLKQLIREAVKEGIAEINDREITRAEAARILRRTTTTIAAMEKRGELHRLPRSGHPRYSEKQIRDLLNNQPK